MIIRKPAMLIAIAGMVAGSAAWPTNVRSHEGDITTNILFNRDIVPILKRRCVACHNDDGLSFPLTTFREVWLEARTIKTSVLRRTMPPAQAVSGFGPFMNDVGMTRREEEVIVSWLDGGAPQTAADISPDPNGLNAAALSEQDAMHWESSRPVLGSPTFTRKLDPISIPGGRSRGIVQILAAVQSSSDRWVRAIEYTPGDPRLVRAVSFTVQETGQWLGTWTPSNPSINLPGNTAFLLPATTHLIAQIHYQGTIEKAVEQGTLALFIADEQPANRVSSFLLKGTAVPGVAAGPSKLAATTRLVRDTHIVALWPEFAEDMRFLQVSATGPDGRVQILFIGRELDAEWPTSYVFKKPVLVAKDAVVSVTGYTDVAKLESVKLTLSGYDKRD